MRFRKLRIVFSAVCGMICLLLVALWVRSYWRADAIGRGTPSNSAVTVLASNYGSVVFGSGAEPAASSLPAEMTNRWGYLSDKARPVDGHFGWKANRREIRIEFPTWLPALVAVALAVAPWVRWRFTLRTMLIATTLVAVGLGLIVAFA